MIKPALLLGTLILSFNAFAASLADLNAALNKANQKATPSPTKIIYGGRDIVHTQVADATEVTLPELQIQAG